MWHSWNYLPLPTKKTDDLAGDPDDSVHHTVPGGSFVWGEEAMIITIVTLLLSKYFLMSVFEVGVDISDSLQAIVLLLWMFGWERRRTEKFLKLVVLIHSLQTLKLLFALAFVCVIILSREDAEIATEEKAVGPAGTMGQLAPGPDCPADPSHSCRQRSNSI